MLADKIKGGVRTIMADIARGLNGISGGRITPNMVTITGLIAHLPIAWLIAQNYLVLAGIWLIIFGLFDTLDGELARLQKRASAAGMFLDSVTDRMKEIMVYTGITYYLVGWTRTTICNSNYKYLTGAGLDERLLFAVVVAVLGGSLLTSYINAWGEAVMSRSKAKAGSINKAFRGGLASFEIRIAILALGLLTGYVYTAVVVIGILVFVTIVMRLYKVFGALSRVQG